MLYRCAIDLDTDYEFVYNDLDRSCRYVPKNSMGKRLKTLECVGVDLAKLKMCGFSGERSNYQLWHNFCSYVLDRRVTVHMYLSAFQDSTCMLTVEFIYPSGSNFYLQMGSNIREILPFSELDLLCIMRLEIPAQMLYWLLNLKSIGDFKGVLDSFSNVFDRKLAFYTKSIDDGVVEFASWD